MMRVMSPFEKKKVLAEIHAEKVKEKQELYEIRHRNDRKKGNKKPTHKVITAYLFIVLTVVLIYSMVAMWHFADLTYLGVLISDIAAQIITFVIYSHHSTAQNSEHGISYMALKEKLEAMRYGSNSYGYGYSGGYGYNDYGDNRNYDMYDEPEG